MPNSGPEGLWQAAVTAAGRAGAATGIARERAGAATSAATGAAGIVATASALVGNAAEATASTLATGAREAAYRIGDAATAATFAVLSAVRGRRLFHPAGAAFSGRLDVQPGPGFGVPLLDEPRSFEAIARFSRGAGTPEPLPDVLGLAVRVLHAHGQGLHQDLLMVTSDRRPLGRHLLLPAAGFLSRSYSSVLPYSVGAVGRFCFGADPLEVPAASGSRHALGALTAAVEQGGLPLRLTLAALPAGAWQPWATLTLTEALPPDVSEQLRFNVMDNTGGGIRPEGLLQHWRGTAYRAAQQARVDG